MINEREPLRRGALTNLRLQRELINKMQSGGDVRMQPNDFDLLTEVFNVRWYRKTWCVTDPSDTKKAARAMALGIPVFAPFAYLYAILGHPSVSAIRHLNMLKGRPEDQVASITTTAPHIERLFDWSFYPSREHQRRISGLLDAILKVGPVGLRGPARDREDMHSLVTKVIDYEGIGEVRTVQPILPGYECISNSFIGACLREVGRDFIVATSPNISKNASDKDSPPHWRMSGIQNDFGRSGSCVLLAHPREPDRDKKQYPEFSWRSSTTILDVSRLTEERGDRLGINIARHGSWPLELLKSIAEGAGFVIINSDVVAGNRLPHMSYSTGLKGNLTKLRHLLTSIF